MAFFTGDYKAIKENSLYGRYITYDHISPLVSNLGSNFNVIRLGKSVKGVPIESIEFGTGNTKILMWSQMHGNEATTTKAVFDVLNFLESDNPAALEIFKKCTVKIIPMLNPDGAVAYTRVNANGIDLNRDAQNLSQVESKVLRKAYDDFKPDYCFNLHDQRTMYNVGDTDESATVSFLAPAFDKARSISDSRRMAMSLIHRMNQVLQELIPGRVGRYDDGFNSNCVGDTFQMMGTPTILFEAGHFPDDYERERTREFIFIALLEAITSAMRIEEVADDEQAAYFNIPENGKLFFDILVENAYHLDNAYDKGTSIGLRYKEVLIDGAIHFEPKIEAIFGQGHYLGHQTYDCAQNRDVERLRELPLIIKLFA